MSIELIIQIAALLFIGAIAAAKVGLHRLVASIFLIAGIVVTAIVIVKALLLL